jgi:hypothetical protein
MILILWWGWPKTIAAVLPGSWWGNGWLGLKKMDPNVHHDTFKKLFLTAFY